MEISTLTLKLIFLLIPGAIAALIHKRLTVRTKDLTDFMFIINSILFGMFSYVALQMLKYFGEFILKRQHEIIDVFANLTDSSHIPYLEILFGSLLALVLSYFATYVEGNKWINRIGKYLNASSKYGDENLYTYFLNSPDIEWVYVRDIRNSLTYWGAIHSFSETIDYKELVLKDVTVYNYPDSDLLYELDSLYLCLSKDDVIIEKSI